MCDGGVVVVVATLLGMCGGEVVVGVCRCLVIGICLLLVVEIIYYFNE